MLGDDRPGGGCHLADSVLRNSELLNSPMIRVYDLIVRLTYVPKPIPSRRNGPPRDGLNTGHR